MPGLFCGVAGRPDLIGKGNNRYRPPIGYRIGSEIVGSSIAVDGDDHYNRGFETGYAAGNRRAIVPEIRKADPALGAGPAPGLELSEPDQPSTRRLNLRDSPGAGVSHARERAVPRELPLRSR